MQSASRPETAHRENLAGRLRKRNSARPTPVIEPQRILELGNGLELWKVHPSALREQDVNARSMPKAMFERIAHSIFEGAHLAARWRAGDWSVRLRLRMSRRVYTAGVSGCQNGSLG